MAANAREVARACLNRTEAAGQYSNLALDTALSRADLSAVDARLATALFYSVLEHRITLDAIIDARATLPPSAIERGVRQILRLALAQLLYFDRIPDHAAINEAVEAAPRRSKGFLNALLRQFCRDGKPLPSPDSNDFPAYLSVRYSVSPALAKTLCGVYGKERTERLLAAFAVPPPITVRVNTTRLSVAEFLTKVPGATPAKHAPSGVVLPPNTPLTPMLEAGLCFVQDEASQIAVAAVDAHPGMRVADLCAAPGSKSFGIAADMQNTGEVFGFDLHENKISLIRRGAAALGLSCITAKASDARRAAAEALGTFDRVLCDVPCSGFGVIAKKPELRYKNPADTAGLLPTQREILAAGAGLVRPGGVLVYSTCTLLPAENEEQAGAFLKTHPDFALTPFAVGGITAGGFLTLTPDHDGTDGFFVAKFTRKG